MNYQYILYGMGFKSDLSANASAYPLKAQAKERFNQLVTAAGKASADLPQHRALVEAICNKATANQMIGKQAFHQGNLSGAAPAQTSMNIQMPSLNFKL